MKYIGEKAIKKLISLIKGDINKKLDKNQGTTNSGKILGVNASGEVAPTDTEVATLVDVPNGLLKGNGTTISAAVAGTDYAAASHTHPYLPLTGGTVTGAIIYPNAEDIYATDGNVFDAKFLVLDSSNQITKTDKNDINLIDAMGVAAKKHTHEKADIKDFPTSITPSAHKASHKTGGSDALSPADIGAAATDHTHNYLPLSGGKLTGNLTGRYITGTWLQTTEATALGSAATKICVLDGSGWVYYRTPAQILSDIGVPTAIQAAIGDAIAASY